MNRLIVARAANVLSPTACHYPWSSHHDQQLFANGVTQDYSNVTTNILIVRDPWTRAVSSFADQIARHSIRLNYTPAAFLHFLRYHADNTSLRHTGTASTMCPAQPGVRFDHIVDLEDISSFARVATRVRNFSRLVDTGWEHCTGGDPHLHLQGTIAPHRNKNRNLPYDLCTAETIREVCRVYHADYQLYARLGRTFKCACLQHVGVR